MTTPDVTEKPNAPAASTPRTGSASSGPKDDDDYDCETVSCGLCGDDGWIMLSEAGPGEWGEDCFCDVDRPIACPECGKPINPAAMLGSISSPAKAEAARENAKLGGWPKGKKRGKRKRVARRSNARTETPPSAGVQ